MASSTLMSRQLTRFGILGCGRITRRGLIPGITASPAAELAALASLRPGVAAELARECGAARAYDSYDALIADPDVDAVYIPTTGEAHRDWTLRAAAAGKHVLCEKSLATTLAEAEEMADRCRRAGVLLQEAFMWRHHPRTKEARRLLAAGAIGELRLVCAHFSFDIDPGDWRLDPARGGGAVWDIGCYGVNAARLFAGSEPEEVHARARFHPSGAETTMQIALRFPQQGVEKRGLAPPRGRVRGNVRVRPGACPPFTTQGVLANIDCSFEAAYRCEVELVGSRGTLTLPDAFLPPPEATLLVRRGTRPEDAAAPIVFPRANQYAEQVTDFCASIAAGRLQSPAEDGVANMRVLESALTQARRA